MMTESMAMHNARLNGTEPPTDDDFTVYESRTRP